MPLLVPPQPPLRVAISDDDHERFWFRLWLVECAILTILATAWCISLGPIPGILSLMVAKDILVALLVAGLGLAQQPVTEAYTVLQQQPVRRDQPSVADTSGGDQEGGRRIQLRG